MMSFLAFGILTLTKELYNWFIFDTIIIPGKDYYVQIRIMGQGDWKYEMSSVESQPFQDVREKIYDCVSLVYMLIVIFCHFIYRETEAADTYILTSQKRSRDVVLT